MLEKSSLVSFIQSLQFDSGHCNEGVSVNPKPTRYGGMLDALGSSQGLGYRVCATVS